jgi:hypothetical protein
VVTPILATGVGSGAARHRASGQWRGVREAEQGAEAHLGGQVASRVVHLGVVEPGEASGMVCGHRPGRGRHDRGPGRDRRRALQRAVGADPQHGGAGGGDGRVVGEHHQRRERVGVAGGQLQQRARRTSPVPEGRWVVDHDQGGDRARPGRRGTEVLRQRDTGVVVGGEEGGAVGGEGVGEPGQPVPVALGGVPEGRDREVGGAVSGGRGEHDGADETAGEVFGAHHGDGPPRFQPQAERRVGEHPVPVRGRGRLPQNCC